MKKKSKPHCKILFYKAIKHYIISRYILLVRASLIAQLVKKSTCNAGDPSSVPGSGRSAGGGIGYPLQYSWASLVAQLVKNPPAMRETWVQPGFDPWRRERLPTPVISGLENCMDCIQFMVSQSRTQLSNFHSLTGSISLILKAMEYNLRINYT